MEELSERINEERERAIEEVEKRKETEKEEALKELERVKEAEKYEAVKELERLKELERYEKEEGESAVRVVVEERLQRIHILEEQLVEVEKTKEVMIREVCLFVCF
jgi:hypothetical protein